MNTMEELRKSFDQVDEELFKLLEKRLVLSRRMGEIKGQMQLGIYDPKREALIFSRLENALNDKALFPYIKEIYFSIFEASKKIQRQKEGSAYREKL